jgi:hypothetical protein
MEHCADAGRQHNHQSQTDAGGGGGQHPLVAQQICKGGQQRSTTGQTTALPTALPNDRLWNRRWGLCVREKRDR